MDKAKINTQKLKYDAEVTVIKSKLGDIESIRNELGMSQRKMAQLLMVDPSAWTRWTQGKTPVPHHIYRSLQWYMALIEKQPEWHPQNSFMKGFQSTNHSALRLELKEHEEKLDKKLLTLQYEQVVAEKINKGKNKLLLFLALVTALQSFVLVALVLKVLK